MKRLIVVILSTILLIIGLCFVRTYCNYIVDKMVDDEYLKIYNMIYPLQSRTILGVDYSNGTIEFRKEEPIPERPSDKTVNFGGTIISNLAKREEVEFWDSNYQGMFKRQQILWNNYYSSRNATNGWCIKSLSFNEVNPLNYYICHYFPFEYVVSDLSPWAKNFLTSKTDLVKEALDWFLKNPSSLSRNAIYESNAYQDAISIINSIPNKFHNYECDSQSQVNFTQGIDLNGKHQGSAFGSVGRNIPLFSNSFGNDNQRVFIAISSPTTYSLIRDEDAIEKEKNSKTLIFVISLIIIYVLFVVSPIKHIISNRSENKMSVKERLLKYSNPLNYVDVDSDKASISNILYSKIMSIPEDKIDELLDISVEVENTLKMCLVNKENLFDALQKVNPKNFMHPYDAIRFEKANSLYQELKSKQVSYKRFYYIQKEIQDLCCLNAINSIEQYHVGQAVVNLKNEEILQIKSISEDGIISCVKKDTDEYVGTYDEFEIADYEAYCRRKSRN